MRVTVKYFASIREAIGCASEQVQTNAATLADLRDQMLAMSPAHDECLARSKPVRLALNQVMSEESAALTDGCEVAFFPPVTGG